MAVKENRREGGTPPCTLMLLDTSVLRAPSCDFTLVKFFGKEKSRSYCPDIFGGFSNSGSGGSPHFSASPLIFSSIFLVLGAFDEMVRGVGPSKKVAHFEGMM